MMVRLNKEELRRVRCENARIRNENHVLRCTLKHLEKNAYSECRDVLRAVSIFCDKKYKSTNYRDGPKGGPFICPENCPCPESGENKSSNACVNDAHTPNNAKVNLSSNACVSEGHRHNSTFPLENLGVANKGRIGAGCSGMLCGGYTPSGWNKLRTMGVIDNPQVDYLQEFSSNNKSPQVDYLQEFSSNNNSERSRPEARQSDAVRSTSEGRTGGKDCRFRPSVRLLGEMAFQLERRILDYVFGLEGPNKRRFYGYTVCNICYMMEKESTGADGSNDAVSRSEMTCRLRKMLSALEKYGYDIKVHADFSQEIINKYGLLPCPPDEKTIQAFGLNDACTIHCLISRLSKRQSEIHTLNILLNCLHFLSKCDGRALFVW